MNLPERDSLTSPGESFVSVFSVVTILHVLVLALDFLSAVAILSLGGNKISCQTTQSNDMKYLDIYYQLILRILEGQTGQVKTDNFPLSLVHSHWSRNVEARLSLVESFIVLLRQLSYAIKNQLGHPKPPTRGFGTQRPNGSLLAPRWFFMA